MPAATNLSDFTAAMASGGARKNQFRLTIPATIGTYIGSTNVNLSNYDNAKDEIPLLCKGASIPAAKIESINVIYRGKTFHEAGETTFDEITLTFYATNKFNIRAFFEDWVNVNTNRDQVGGANVAVKADTITLEHLDRNGNIVRTYYLHGAMPTNVGQVELSYDQGTDIEEVSVTLSYDYFTVQTKR